MAKKRFTQAADGLLENVDILDADAMLGGFFAATSERTAPEAPLEDLPTDGAIVEKQPAKPQIALDELDELPIDVNENYVRAYEQAAAQVGYGKADELARKTVLTTAPAVLAPMPGGGPMQPAEPDEEFTEHDGAVNKILIEEGIELYDALQSMAAIAVFDKVNKPTTEIQVAQALRAKMESGNISVEERAAFLAAFDKAVTYNGRKEKFASETQMKDSVKQSATRLATRLLALENVRLNPWAVLAFLMLIQPIINLIRVYGEKWGFGGDDAEVATKRLEKFVDTQEKLYYRQQQNPKT